MQNFNTYKEAKKYAVDYFEKNHNYLGAFDYRNNKGIIKFFTVDSPQQYHTFECTIFASHPLVSTKNPVGRPKGPEKVYIGFKIEPKYHAEVKAMVKKYIADKNN